MNPRRERYPDASPASSFLTGSGREPPPTLGRVKVEIAGVFRLVTPLPDEPESDQRTWHLLLMGRPPSADVPARVSVTEHDDPESGCLTPGYLGLSCSCDVYDPSAPPCAHIEALVRLGLLRPAPGWDSWTATEGLEGLAPAPSPTSASVPVAESAPPTPPPPGLLFDLEGSSGSGPYRKGGRT